MRRNNNTNSKVTQIILDAPRLHANVIDQALSNKDIRAIDEFENKWRSFLSSHPNVLPPGKTLKSCLELQSQLEEIEISKQMVEIELQRQLEFFSNSKDQLEANFTKAMQEAALIQQEVSRSLNKEIDDVAVADQILSKTLPWEHFFYNLNRVTEEAYTSNDTTAPSFSKESNDMATEDNTVSDGTATAISSKKSHAMFLVNIDHQEAFAKANKEEKSSAMLRNALKIDNVLLKIQLKMMQHEIDRLERTARSQKELSKFLSEYNIWGLLGGAAQSRGKVAGPRKNATVATRSPVARSLPGQNNFFHHSMQH